MTGLLTKQDINHCDACQDWLFNLHGSW